MAEQKIMLLTGASRGIGHATVKRFAREGWRVITCSRHAFPENCPWGSGREDHIQIDLANPARTQEAIAEIRARLGGRLDAPEQDWVHVFAEWMASALKKNRIDDLLHYRTRAPEAVHNHPTEEHLLPLYVALGAGARTIRHLHQSTTYGILRMDAFAFE